MAENRTKLSGIAFVAVLLGAAGIALGVYASFMQTPVPGAPGEDGTDGLPGIDGVNGTDGLDAPGHIVVGILDPNEGGTVSGSITIRALIAGSNTYTLSVLRNGTQIATQVPFDWNTGAVPDGDYNITVIATDVPSANVSQDQVVCSVLNDPQVYEYYCDTQAEITGALTAIGTGSGTITITEDITLSSTITVNGGGDYIVQGIAPGVTLSTGNFDAIDVTAVSTCTLRDLTIDVSGFTSQSNAIHSSDDFVHVENIIVFGDADGWGMGIVVQGSNTWVKDCYITNITTGIRADSNVHTIEISGNTILYCNGSTVGKGIDLNNVARITCMDNRIELCRKGIALFAVSNSVVEDNILYQNWYSGIDLEDSSDNTITGNVITGLTSWGTTNHAGIYLLDHCDYNVISSNLIKEYNDTGTGTAYGICIVDTTAEANTIVGNTMLQNDQDYSDGGTGTVAYGNNYLP